MSGCIVGLQFVSLVSFHGSNHYYSKSRDPLCISLTTEFGDQRSLLCQGRKESVKGKLNVE